MATNFNFGNHKYMKPFRSELNSNKINDLQNEDTFFFYSMQKAHRLSVSFYTTEFLLSFYIENSILPLYI